MRRHPRQFARDRAIYVLHHRKIRGEENVEIPLVHIWRRDLHVPSLIPRLHHGRVDPGHGVRKEVKVRQHESVGGEILVQNIEELHQPRGDVFWFRQVGGKR